MSQSTKAVLRFDQPAQDQIREWFLNLGTMLWLPLIAVTDQLPSNVGVLSALAPRSFRAKALSGPGWDLQHGEGTPGFSQTRASGRWVTRYHRFGSDPVEPLVIQRRFHGVLPDYDELSEEFRLFHNLHSDHATGHLLKMDDAGTTSVAGFIERDEIPVGTRDDRHVHAHPSPHGIRGSPAPRKPPDAANRRRPVARDRSEAACVRGLPLAGWQPRAGRSAKLAECPRAGQIS